MIVIENLKKHLDGKWVLDGVDLTIESGETIVIIGQSGCGKSVLLKHIVGLMQADEGRVIIDNNDIAKMNRRSLNELRLRIGVLFQGSALFDSITVGENVGFPLLEQKRMKLKDVIPIVHDKLELVGLEDVANKMPAELSGGMKKRVGLARAIATDPDIVLYDEPTTGLDPIMADVINDLILELKHKIRMTSVVVTHDMKSAYKVADRIAMLFGGKIIFVGTPDELKRSRNPVIQQFIEGSAKGPIMNNHNNHNHHDNHS